MNMIRLVITSILIAAGIVILIISLYKMRKLSGVLPLIEKKNQSWLIIRLKIHIILTVFFIAGYVATAVSLVLDSRIFGDVFIGAIYFTGAAFVLLGTGIQTKMVGEITSTIERLVPICAFCKQIRYEGADPEKKESWAQVDKYFAKEHYTKFSHSVCPTCLNEKFAKEN